MNFAPLSIDGGECAPRQFQDAECDTDRSRALLPTPMVLQNGRKLSTESESSGHPSATRLVRYKTEMCRNFKERGMCIYGDQCQFAHGQREMREVTRNTKYKTKRCMKYWSDGYCVYGPRCNFLHMDNVAVDALAASTNVSAVSPLESCLAESKLESERSMTMSKSRQSSPWVGGWLSPILASPGGYNGLDSTGLVDPLWKTFDLTPSGMEFNTGYTLDHF